MVPHPWPQVLENHPGVGLDQPLWERGQAEEQLRPLKSPCPSVSPLCTCPAPGEAAAAPVVGAWVLMTGSMEGSPGRCPAAVLQDMSEELAGQNCTS